MKGKSITLLVFYVLIINLFGYRLVLLSFKAPYFEEVAFSSSDPIISINGNVELSFQASSGNGSQINPFILEDRVIDGFLSDYCILINNTNKYFTLRNCSIFNAAIGIQLNNCSFGSLSKNYVHNNTESGIYLSNCANTSLDHNLIYNNTYFGIEVNSSYENEFLLNVVQTHAQSGISIKNSANNEIISNIFSFNNVAIFLEHSNSNFVSFNNGTANNFTIVEINSFGNVLLDNFISHEQNGSDGSKPFVLDFTFPLLLIIGLMFSILGIKKLIYKLKSRRFQT